MSSRKSRALSLILICVGILLILSPLTYIGIEYYQNKTLQKENSQTVSALYTLLPTVRDSIPAQRTDPTMPAVELDGNNYIGILEIPSLSRSLPIGARWEQENADRYPCRFLGSVYDGSLILGGIDFPGQMDWLDVVEQGTLVQLTDVSGKRYSYEIVFMEKRDEMTSSFSPSCNSDLVLFSQNIGNGEFTLAYACVV